MIAYVGGKYRQAKWICSFIPKNISTYTEIFGGAMWVYLNGNINCEKAVYNDYNPFMANLFSCCVEYDEFLKWINSIEPQNEETFYGFKKDINAMYKMPHLVSNYMPLFDIGTKYSYLATQTFSGIVNEKIKMVDLKGKYRSKFLSFRDRLKKKEIQKKLDILKVYNKSYEDMIPLVDDKNNYMYLDPPYYGTENLYGFHDFGLQDHDKLQSLLKNCESKWSLSYYEFPDLKKWFPEDKFRWERKEYKKASMASKDKKQSVGVEVLIMNY